MKVLDNLKRVFESKFRDLFANNTFKLVDFSRNTTYVLDKDPKNNERLLINTSKANEEEKKNIKEILDKLIQEDNEVFLTNKDVSKTIQIKKNLPKLGDEDLLKYYKDKLTPDVHKALEMSLVVRNVFRSGEDILELKRDIARKFPDWGNNLCNLVTSNYFDIYFKELYDAMFVEEEFNINEYQKEVERIIISLPYMVFINRYKSLEEFKGEVKFKLSKLKKYGTDKLKLHAIGKENVEKLLSITEDYINEESIIIEKDINLNKTIATIILRF